MKIAWSVIIDFIKKIWYNIYVIKRKTICSSGAVGAQRTFNPLVGSSNLPSNTIWAPSLIGNYRGAACGKYGGDLVQVYGGILKRWRELSWKQPGRWWAGAWVRILLPPPFGELSIMVLPRSRKPFVRKGVGVRVSHSPPIHSEPNLARASSRTPQGKCNTGNEYSRTGSLLTISLIL